MKQVLLLAVPALVALGLGVIATLILQNQGAGPVWYPFPFNLVLTEECAQVYLKDLNFTHMGCFKTTLSRAVGYAIVFVSSVLKLPMILNVWKSQSTIGLNTDSVAMESIAQAFSISASIKKELPFGLWGEHCTIYAQNIALILLAVRFSPQSAGMDLSKMGAVIAITLVVVGAVPAQYSDVLVAISTLLSMSSRLPQLVDNYKQKHTGVLSIVTQTLQFVGGVVRLLTVFAGTQDFGTRLGISVATLLNFLMLFQVVLYWENTQRELVAREGKKRE